MRLVHELGIPEELPSPRRFVSSDLYKVMEGAACLLLLEPDPELGREMEDTALDQSGRAGKRAMDQSENKQSGFSRSL